MVEVKLTVCLPVMLITARTSQPGYRGPDITNTDLLFARLFCLQLPNDFTLDFNRFLNLCFNVHDFSMTYLSKAWTVAVNSIAIKPGGVTQSGSKNCNNFLVTLLTQFVFISKVDVGLESIYISYIRISNISFLII